jgi:signal transduction histidine kinase
MGIIYEIEGESLLKTQGVEAPISPNSAISRTDEDVMQGICVPIRLHEGVRWYLQLERPTQGRTVRFRQEDLALVRSMATRVEDRIDNLELIHANQRLHANAALGLFAGMIGHDIKNYLFFGKHLSEIRDDPLSMHPGIAKGIERARKLAQGMKDLAAPGHVRLKPFAVRDLVVSTAQEFKSLFGKQCHFECWGGEELEPVTTSEELLSRVVWNLVMNAYHASENRFSSLHAVPIIRVGAAAVEPDSFVVTVEDNVGGIGPRTLEYMQRSFDLIARVYTRQEDLVDVVNEISKMEGFTNSVGLFFTAVAVNDMSGSISVATEPGKGSIFTVQLPREIKTLRNLLRF